MLHEDFQVSIRILLEVP